MQDLTPVPRHGVTPVVGVVLIASHADQGLLVTPGPGAQQVIKTRLVIVLSLLFYLGPQSVSLLHHGYQSRAVTLHHGHSDS